MASIMTATRNSMNIITLDALMQIASNGPTFDHLSSSGDHEINLILEASFDHWKLTRFPARAHGRQGRRKKAASAPVADLFEQQARAARKASGDGRLLEESDDDSSDGSDEVSDGDGGDGGGGGAADVTCELHHEYSGNFETVGDYEVPSGWEALEPPAHDEETWSLLKKSYKWHNKRLAHIWDEPTGWKVSPYSPTASGRKQRP